jgi:hypothetical protein
MLNSKLIYISLAVMIFTAHAPIGDAVKGPI